MRNQQTITTAVQTKNGVVQTIGRSVMIQPKTNFKGGSIKWLEDTYHTKLYRVDTFPSNKQRFFNTEREAIEYGEAQVKHGGIAFLLKILIDNKYDVVREIK